MIHLEITGRHVEVTPALRDFAAEKLTKLERLLDGPIEAHVVLGIEKHRHFAEVQIKSKTGVFSGHQETGDLYASIREVADKLERQALKHKEKIQNHKHRHGPRDPEVAATIEANVAKEIMTWCDADVIGSVRPGPLLVPLRFPVHAILVHARREARVDAAFIG